MRFLTAGESHGKGLVIIIEGVPANLPLSAEDINQELRERQKGYGRGGRMKIESDTAEILSGIRHGRTIGSPISLLIRNKDWENWQTIMSAEPVNEQIDQITNVRPGHADLPGMLKYNQSDLRNILERSSARETAARVAAGAIARKYLNTFGIEVWSHVTRIGSVTVPETNQSTLSKARPILAASELRCQFPEVERLMKQEIDQAKEQGVTLGGIFEVIVENVPPGLGSHVHWDRRLDGLLAQAVMSIQAIKGVEVGLGFGSAILPGNLVHDEVFYEASRGFFRETNRSGGIEGGITNGSPIIIKAAMKPIPTMKQALRTVDIATKKPVDAHFERSDNCAVPSAALVGESMTALTIAGALMDKLGGDYIEEQHERFSVIKRK